MSPLFFKEEDVAGLVSVPETIDVLETAFAHQTKGEATTLPRRRLATDRIFLHLLAGGNMILRREVDSETIFRSDRLIADSIEQARIEGGELIPTLGHGRRHWDELVEMRDVVNGYGGRRSEDDVTFLKSQGVGLEDVALGALIYERARENGIGQHLRI